ncbi:hypothetical protein Tco_1456619 [Tanacetum coccineum]
MHTSIDDYLINTLRFVSAKEESQINGARLPKSMTSLMMRETKAYKTYLGYATGVTPPKKVRKFKKHASPKLSIVPASPEEPTRKSKRVNRPAKKYFDALTSGVVIRETHVKSFSKKKEKTAVEKCKGIDLLFEVALTEEAQYEEVRKKSLRDFHKTHPSGSGTVTKLAPSAAKIKPSVTNKETGAKIGVLGVTEEESIESENKSWGRDEDDSNNDYSDHETDENETSSKSDQEENEEDVEDDEEEKDDELVKTPSNSTDNEDETNVKDKIEGDEDEGMDYTTNQFDDDVNVRLNEPVTTDEGFIQKEGIDAEMTNKTKVTVTSSSHSSDLASKFLNFLDIPHTDAKIISPMDVRVHHEVPSNQTPALLTILVSVITESSPILTTVIPQSLPSFTPPPQQSTPTLPPTTEASNPLSTLPNFSSVFQFNNKVTILEKEVAELKKNDPLNTQVTALVDEHCNTPKMGCNENDVLGTLLHNTIAQDMRERPLNESFENDTMDLINVVTKAQRLNLFILENVKILDHDKYFQNVTPLNLYAMTPK